MKTWAILILVIILGSCTKDESLTPEKQQKLSWSGIYSCIDMVNDSTGQVQPQSNINILSPVVGDSIMLGGINTVNGSYYFNDVAAHVDTNYNIVVLGAYINGSNATLNARNWHWASAAQLHDLVSATLTLNSDNSIVLKYSELDHGLENGCPMHSGDLKSYTGTFRK